MNPNPYNIILFLIISLWLSSKGCLAIIETSNVLYKINSFQFYSKSNDKYSIKYQVLKEQPVEQYNFHLNKVEYVMKYIEDFTCYSKVDLLKYFINEYKGM